MSVWPECGTPSPALRGTEGELVSLRISVEPRLLEQALEVLARLGFPINPQIYHDAVTTVVEFPAWAGRLSEVREALRRNGFDPGALTVRGMLEDIRAVA
jgi:hypothetical protein